MMQFFSFLITLTTYRPKISTGNATEQQQNDFSLKQKIDLPQISQDTLPSTSPTLKSRNEYVKSGNFTILILGSLLYMNSSLSTGKQSMIYQAYQQETSIFQRNTNLDSRIDQPGIQEDSIRNRIDNLGNDNDSWTALQSPLIIKSNSPTTSTTQPLQRMIPTSPTADYKRTALTGKAIIFLNLNLKPTKLSTTNNLLITLTIKRSTTSDQRISITDESTTPTSATVFQQQHAHQLIINHLISKLAAISERLHRLRSKSALDQYQWPQPSPVKSTICLLIFILLMISAIYLLHDITNQTTIRLINKKRPSNNNKRYNSKISRKLKTNLNLSK
jgi:hypothetical protein